MRNLALTIFFLATSLVANINWLDDYDNALDLAEKKQEKILVMLSRENCPACQYMNGVVFKDKKVSQYINENFIALHLDVDRDFLPDELTYIGTPTFYFLEPNAIVLSKIRGAFNIKDFSNILQRINNKKAE